MEDLKLIISQNIVSLRKTSGMTRIGLVAHSNLKHLHGHDVMRREILPAFRSEMARLTEAYGDQAELFCGLELDHDEPVEPSDYDYLIGSVHWMEKDGRLVSALMHK